MIISKSPSKINIKIPVLKDRLSKDNTTTIFGYKNLIQSKSYFNSLFKNFIGNNQARPFVAKAILCFGTIILYGMNAYEFDLSACHQALTNPISAGISDHWWKALLIVGSLALLLSGGTRDQNKKKL